MTNNVVIALSCGTDNPNRSARAFHPATIAPKEGRKGLADNLQAATGEVADDLIAYLQAHGVPILVCTPCAKARQISVEDLIEGARLGTAVELIHLACDAAVISL